MQQWVSSSGRKATTTEASHLQGLLTPKGNGNCRGSHGPEGLCRVWLISRLHVGQAEATQSIHRWARLVTQAWVSLDGCLLKFSKFALNSLLVTNSIILFDMVASSCCHTWPGFFRFEDLCTSRQKLCSCWKANSCNRLQITVAVRHCRLVL